MANAPKGTWSSKEPDQSPVAGDSGPADRAAAASDGRDTIGGHLRANAPLMKVILAVVVPIIVGGAGVYVDLRSQIGATRDSVAAVDRRLALVESRLNSHVNWHRDGVGANPGEPEPSETEEGASETDETDEDRPEANARPPRTGAHTSPFDGIIVPRNEVGEPQPPAIIRDTPEEQLQDALRRAQEGTATPADETLVAAWLGYAAVWSHWSLGEASRRLYQGCVADGVPPERCSEMFPEDRSAEACNAEMSVSECIAAIRAARPAEAE